MNIDELKSKFPRLYAEVFALGASEAKNEEKELTPKEKALAFRKAFEQEMKKGSGKETDIEAFMVEVEELLNRKPGVAQVNINVR